MDPLEDFTTAAGCLVGKVLKAWEIDLEPIFDDAPEGMGDLAFPCFPLARTLRKAPKVIAEELAVACLAEIDDEQWDGIAAVEAVNGYLNITFDTSLLIKRTLTAVTSEQNEFGKGTSKGESIILEHTSANPNGPFHVGRARNPIIGDTLGRILSSAGYDVTTEYYVNDMGKQAVTLAWGVENFEEGSPGDKGKFQQADEKSDDHLELAESTEMDQESIGFWSGYEQKADHALVGKYQKASAMMESDPEVLGTINSMLESYERGDREIGEKVGRYCNQVLNGMQATLEKINVHLDSYAFESKFVYDGDVTNVIDILNRSEHSHEEDSARFLELESFGIHGRDTRFFYTRKGGTSLYTTRDLAYHMNKFTRADRVIDVLGEDHKLQAQQLGIALGELGEERRPEAIFYAFVSLPEGKMSTRKGRVVYLDHLIEEALERAYEEVTTKRPELPEEERRSISELVGIGAIRFNILRVQKEKAITFKWEEALSFDGDSAPFIQYAHARACSILRKAEWGSSVADSLSIIDGASYGNPYELSLIRLLARFPGMVQYCAKGLKIHPMASYLRDLAQEFNQFYRECPVMTAEENERMARLVLVDSFRTVMANGLHLLGVAAPESM